MFLDNWLAQRAQTCPDRTALIAEGQAVTYEELEAEATAAARRLAAHGARGGAAVTLELPVGPDYVIFLHALMKLGAIAEPLNTRLAPTEREAELERAGPALAVSRAGDAAGPEADWPLLGEHDLDAIHCRVLTTGTSGHPRPIGLTYGNHLWASTRPTAGSAACRSTTSVGWRS
jgi:O-succinylbenzoic acid--CoA ligase